MDIKDSYQTKSRLVERRLKYQGNPHHPAMIAPHLDVMHEDYSQDPTCDGQQQLLKTPMKLDVFCGHRCHISASIACQQ